MTAVAAVVMMLAVGIMAQVQPSIELLTAEADQYGAAVIRVTFTNTGLNEALVRKDVFQSPAVHPDWPTSVNVRTPAGRVFELNPAILKFVHIKSEMASPCVTLPPGGTFQRDVTLSVAKSAGDSGYEFIFAEPGIYRISVRYGDNGNIAESQAVELSVREVVGEDGEAVLDLVRSLAKPTSLFYPEYMQPEDVALVEQIADTTATQHSYLAKLAAAERSLRLSRAARSSPIARQEHLDRAQMLLEGLEPLRSSAAWGGRVTELSAQVEVARRRIE